MARADSLASNRTTDAFERVVAAALDSHLDRPGPLIVACSGGPDSSAALIAVARVAGDRAAEVVAAHFDHRIRAHEETEAERAYVESLAGCLGIDTVSGHAG